MSKKKKWKSGQSNLVKIGGVLLLAATAILVVQFGNFKTRFILPEEHAERAARRASPDNAFHILIEAGSLLPRRKPYVLRVPDDERPGHTIRYEADPDSAGMLLRIARPEDDPDLIDYVHQSEPALEKAREALDKPFFAYQETSPYRRGNSVQWCTDLPRHLLARARIATFVENKPEDAPKALIDALRITRLLEQDEPYASSIERHGLRQIRLFAHSTNNTALLTQVQEPLDTLGLRFPDRTTPLKLLWREVDSILLAPNVSEFDPISARIMLWKVQNEADEIIKNKDLCFQLAAVPLTELERWIQDNPDTLDEETLNTISVTIQVNASYLATNLVIAIEQYEAEHGTYPKELAELVPTYLPKIPTDPITDGPFAYRTTDTGYLLYSLGGNGLDDNAAPELDTVYIGPE